MKPKELGIYIHIPFCKQKCYYCDFISYQNKTELIEQYINSICLEIENWKANINEQYNVTTIYIGGGTPSYIEPIHILKILKHLNEFINQNVEITIEVNPGTVTNLKLQEYRMTSGAGMNLELKHLTVLEEAHNLLRRTSTEQSSESGNLLGKSVEMLSNAIAEMRTYGEGFIIADQAPGLMDMSAIRNTNTKIIMRLPDKGDRDLVGRAANLDEDQIIELAKLSCGVAAVYQNEWVQPVLCKVKKFERAEEIYNYKCEDNTDLNYDTEVLQESLLAIIMEKGIENKGGKTDILRLRESILKSKLETRVKCDFIEYVSEQKEDAVKVLRNLVYNFLTAENAIRAAKDCTDICEWTREVVDNLNPSIKEYSSKQIDLALALIIYEQSMRDSSYNDVLCRFTEIYMNEGRVY